MHPNPAFRGTPADTNIAFARDRAFGTLALNGAETPMLSHVPFLLAEDGSHADLHLVRSNPISRSLKAPQPATLAVTGPDSYISPDWYALDDQVPTWNYVAVHLTGTLAPLPDTDLPSLLERLSTFFETRLAPKPVWTMDKMQDEALSRMLRMIRPFRLTITDIQGTWKLNQNNPDAARQGAANHVASDGIGAQTDLLADLMHAATGDTP
jgi:transcriptional regulator